MNPTSLYAALPHLTAWELEQLNTTDPKLDQIIVDELRRRDDRMGESLDP